MGTPNTAHRNTLATSGAGAFNRLSIYDGATLLITFTISWTAASGGSRNVASTPVAGTAVASGTADTAKLHHSSGSDEIDGLTVGTAGTEVIIDDTNITNGGNVNLISFYYTAPSSTTA